MGEERVTFKRGGLQLSITRNAHGVIVDLFHAVGEPRMVCWARADASECYTDDCALWLGSTSFELNDKELHQVRRLLSDVRIQIGGASTEARRHA